ncbi:asparagine synthase (glutamine-hydrolyzing) [Noviherbaspirillum cavernae]|uniref:asparagine synthase (glutamine-hydrolyzing) n=1 Tax=Noviherbaspirillum cavernae TaxID=2320862 RepID=A0A418WWU3_9BURK|nr:asparagine synthase (glutamine-hydrolyzing) [Noviherbaspirillum cavernae]RJG04672.1 asparagine synthase (glutamine-hydrolyzing) [Noviherbaspirillum cavernae]
MCGVAGYIDKKENVVQQSLISAMTEVISHRGPDAFGHYLGRNFALGHRRLAIVDLSEDGRQPMQYPATGCVITYNGEIYNYLELRAELESAGYQFHTKTDTEVILAAYAAWGEACVQRFNGMWSFAIYDPHKEILFCSRDRFGVKPFYYLDDAGRFAFGSEIRQLLPLAGAQANEQVVLDFLLTSFADHADETFFKGIHKLPAGHNLIYDLNSHVFRIERFYRITQQPQWTSKGVEQAAGDYVGLLDDAVKVRLRADVPVGTCLSGGLDSSSVATLAAKRYAPLAGKPFIGITAIGESPRTDESAFAQEVAKEGGMKWVPLRPTYDDFVRTLPDVVAAQEEPYAGPSVNMQWFVMRTAREQGITVLLDGQGGDETLLGYEKYYAAHIATVWREKGVFSAVRAVLDARRNNAKMGFLNTAKYLIAGLSAPARYRFYRYQHRYLKALPPLPSQLSAYSRACLDEFALQELEISKTNLPILLRYEDKNSMAHSIETRLPFLDYRALEAALSIPAGFKIKDGWTKWVLRKGMADKMPASIVWRKNKLGFEAPEDLWLGKHRSQMKSTVLASPLLNKLCDIATLGAMYEKLDLRTQWRLYSTALWEEKFGVRS